MLFCFQLEEFSIDAYLQRAIRSQFSSIFAVSLFSKMTPNGSMMIILDSLLEDFPPKSMP